MIKDKLGDHENKPFATKGTRGRPRGSFTGRVELLILLLLRHAPQTASMLAESLEIKANSIRKHLSVLKLRGFVAKDEETQKWFLLPKGAEYVESRITNYYFIIKNKELLTNYQILQSAKEKRMKSEEKAKKNTQKLQQTQVPDHIVEKLMIELGGSSSIKYRKVKEIMDKVHDKVGELNDIEEALVRELAEVKVIQGRNYLECPKTMNPIDYLCDVLEKRLGYRPASTEVAEAIENLKAFGIIYVYVRPRQRIYKLRLDKSILS